MKKKSKAVKSKAVASKAKSRVQPTVQSKSAMAMAMQSSSPMTQRTMSEPEQQMTPFSSMSVLFVLYFLAQSVIVYLASMAFPNMVVLGTDSISQMMALIYSMGVLAVLVVAFMPMIELTAKAFSFKMKDMHWMLVYLVINFAGLWMVARFAEVLGLGLSSWMVVAALAFVINAAQGLITTQVLSWMKK